MQLLLLSMGTGALQDFLARSVPEPPSGRLRLGYVTDATTPFAGLPFVEAERSQIEALGHEVEELHVAALSLEGIERALDRIDALYVAGGSTFALLAALRSTGADHAIADRVRRGLPYVGLSAGSIVVGPSIEPASLMDDPADAPELDDYTGLRLVDEAVIPHADGQLPPYSAELIERTVTTYGDSHRLVLLRDDQAILVDSHGPRIIDSAP